MYVSISTHLRRTVVFVNVFLTQFILHFTEFRWITEHMLAMLMSMSWAEAMLRISRQQRNKGWVLWWGLEEQGWERHWGCWSRKPWCSSPPPSRGPPRRCSTWDTGRTLARSRQASGKQQLHAASPCCGRFARGRRTVRQTWTSTSCWDQPSDKPSTDTWWKRPAGHR